MHSPREQLEAHMSTDLTAALAARQLDVEAVVQAIGLRPGDVAYVAGSLVDGLGGADADLDIFVLTDRAGLEARRASFDTERLVQQSRHDFGIAYIQARKTELDVEFHPVEKFDALFQALDEMRPVTRRKLWESFRSLGPYERPYALELLHRLRCSWPLGSNAAYAALRARFDEQTFLDWNALFSLMECEDFTKGTRRSLRDGDLQSACLKLRYFYDSLVDSALFTAGESLDRWKWRLPKLRRLGDAALLEDYLLVQLAAPARDGAALADFVTTALERGLLRHSRLMERFH